MLRWDLISQGFRKVDPDRWEFANQGFLRGERHLLKTIQRRRPPAHPPHHRRPVGPCLEVGRFGLDGEIDRLKRDKNILMSELVKLRQEHQNTRACIHAMEERIQGTEQKQQQMMTFLARAMQNPAFIHQLVQEKERRKEIEEAIGKKRRRSIDQGPDGGDLPSPGNPPPYVESTIKLEACRYDCDGPESSAEAEYHLAHEMNAGNHDEGDEEQEGRREEGGGERELNDDFWEELLSEGIVDESGGPVAGEIDAEEVDVLAEKLRWLSSTSAK